MSRWREEWIEQDEDRLRDLVLVPGITVRDMARDLKRPAKSVVTKIQHLGLDFERRQAGIPWSDERVDQLKMLWAEGLSASQIAGRLGGVTRNSVIGKLHRLGLTRETVRPTKTRSKQRKAAPDKPVRRAVKPSPLMELMKLPLPEEPANEIARTNIIDREKDQCAWIIGETKDMKCCGAPVVPGLPYGTPFCADHAKRSFQPPNVKRGPFVLETNAEAVARKNARNERVKEAA